MIDDDGAMSRQQSTVQMNTIYSVAARKLLTILAGLMNAAVHANMY